MITVNLLPENLRKEENPEANSTTFLVIVMFAVVILLHCAVGLLIIAKKIQLATVEAALQSKAPQHKEVDDLKKEVEIKKDKIKAMEQIAKRTIYWTDFFNAIIKIIPKGLWMNRLSFTDGDLLIEGSVFSFGADEVSLVNIFFNDLKNSPFFAKNFRNLNLDSVQRRTIKEYEILDFLLTGEFIGKVGQGKDDKTKKR